jgi:hypothetical protein
MLFISCVGTAYPGITLSLFVKGAEVSVDRQLAGDMI